MVNRTVYLIGPDGLIRYARRGMPQPQEVLAAAKAVAAHFEKVIVFDAKWFRSAAKSVAPLIPAWEYGKR